MIPHAAGPGAERGVRSLWIALVAGFGVALSPLLACVTPFAALATVAALKLGLRDRAAVLGAIWLANQAIGFAFLGYPLTWGSAAWGVAIGISTGIAALAAAIFSAKRPAPFAVSLPLLAAFATFELSLDIFGLVLPGSDGAFAASIVFHVLLINVVTLCVIMATYHLSMWLSLPRIKFGAALTPCGLTRRTGASSFL
jgi:hypothetical protein